MQNSRFVAEYEHVGGGYQPCFIGPKWQVAQLNYVPDLAPEVINKLIIHHNSDKSLFLLDGQAVLIAADIQHDSIYFEVNKLKSGVLYNVPRARWHNIALSKDAKVLITQDAYTHIGDENSFFLSQIQHDELISLIRTAWEA